MRSHKITFITTVYNEAKSIDSFLDSLLAQTKLPDEIIIVDGGSTDATLNVIARSLKATKQDPKNRGLLHFVRNDEKKLPIKVIVKKGNRSVGRNEAIKQATGDIIVCSDAGNILDKKWIEEITKPFQLSSRPNEVSGGISYHNGKRKVSSARSSRRDEILRLSFDKLRIAQDDRVIDVVAGYYRGKATTIFQKCLIPYALVMPDKVDPETFLPATRSIAFTKKIWKKVGGFDERYSHNEDYVFANSLKVIGANIVFSKKAIVHWIPRKTFKQAFIMFFRFALGDAESGMWRSNVLLLFARYLLGMYLLSLCLLYQSLFGGLILLLLFLSYLVWAVKKNERYVQDKRVWYLLPALQLTADAAVLLGTFWGSIRVLYKFSYLVWIKNNVFFLSLVASYLIALLLTISWGIPTQEHPFPYHMDEWHQLQAVANTFRYGTPNTFGSANGTMFHFLYSGVSLLPFMAFQIIDPFSLQIDNLAMREKIFIVLRLQTILFGILSLFVLAKIATLLQLSKKVLLFFFTITPAWMMFSGYFKYDIALMFWILLAFFFLFRFALKPTKKNYLIAAIPIALSFSVKVSAAPLIPIYALAYVMFFPEWKKNIKSLLFGFLIVFATIILFGFPDTLFGKGNVLLYLYENIIQTPATTTNFIFGMHPLAYLIIGHYPILFGHGLLFSFAISFCFFLFFLITKRFTQQRIALFILISFMLFAISILPLQIYGGGNRSLVLLPFFVLILAFVWKDVHKTRFRTSILAFLILTGVIQLYTSAVWVYLKLLPSPQSVSSQWIIDTVPRSATFGLENIPIYQNVPHVVQKEFYFAEYGVSSPNRYRYEIIDATNRELPIFVIVTGDEIEKQVIKNSPKKVLLSRLDQDGYKKVAKFSVEGRQYLPWMSNKDYYFSWMGLPPETISIYKK